MTENSTSKILFVINPKSGTASQDCQTVIQNYCKHFPNNLHFYTLTGKNDAYEMDKAITRLRPNTIAAVGGDGTVSMIVKKVLESNMNLAIIPTGSANGMARELNISENINEALKVLENGVVKKADVLKINNLLCIHLSDIGMNAHLIKYFDRGNMRGKWGYAKLALKVFFRRQNIQAIFRFNGKEIKRKTLMVVVANASKYGTGAVINPSGNISDGLFEVVVIKHIGLLTLLKLWLRPNSPNPDNIETFQTNEVSIQFNKKFHFQIDGEYIGKVKAVSARMLSTQINIIVPKEI